LSLFGSREATPVSHGEVAKALAARFDFALSESIDPFEPIDLWTLCSEPFSIGVVYGPSGSGKTQAIARLAPMPEPLVWSEVESVADHFATADIAQDCFAAVGLHSVPQMMKPYRLLSNGEQYRVTLARRLAERGTTSRDEILCVDEFTSVVDRTVAHGLCVSLRRQLSPHSRVVVASCHADIIEWLRPDWVVHTLDGSVSRGGSEPVPRWRLMLGEKIATGVLGG
jgi:hypothetical protein